MHIIEQILLNKIKFIGDDEFTLLGTPQQLIDELIKAMEV